MVEFDRRDFLKAAGGTVGASLLAGCTGGGGGDSTKVGMVYATGGLGDGSFNDQAQQGLQQAEEELGITYEESQPEDNSDFAPMQEQFAQDGSYDLVNCIGFAQKDALTTNAEDFPDQKWTIIDDQVDSDNVASYGFTEETGSYLVGQMAAMLTQREFSAGAGETAPDSTTVGFVGGIESPLIKKFEGGFQAGVKDTDENIEVLSSYVGSFNDPSAGQSQARSMYDSGADIVYHASGATGVGVFRAAQDLGRFAIGVDRDQSVTQPDFSDVILSSMVKRVDTAIFNAVEAVDQGEFNGGEVTRLGLEDEGIAVVYGDELGSDIPQDVKDAVSDSREAIIAGDIDVPTEPQ
jgi:basic membrane protein A